MKLLVLGCGSIGKRHAQNALKLNIDIGIFDRDQRLAKSFAGEIGIQSFNTLDEGLAWQPDGVIVATPHMTHVELAQNAIDAGAHVLIEKPISGSVENVDALLKSAERKERQVYVVCNMRFHDAVIAIHENIKRIGRVLYANADYGNYLPNMRPNADYKSLYSARKEDGGGVILDVIHEIDYMMWLFGGVQKVNCIAKKLSNLDINVEDYANMTLEHSSGVISNITVDYLKPYKRRGCEIVGDQGMIIWQSEGKSPEKCSVKLFQASTQEWINLYQADDVDPNSGYQRLIKAFKTKIEYINTHTNLSDGQQGLDALKVALAAHRSAEMGGICIE